ncbi:lipid A biosynthesis acyltransferase [Flavobacterium sp. Fl-77]|uniref:Lipid A biosynthesis acyltransferase n=1 Tax=Flavobacterium flavipigmentatum TaxID=2893884 RepID=A0AAJ2S6W9_9FLAO|nr:MULTISPECIES: lipid A biosynthesis acyltransferase [unclassified Flavobacterium]MDX6181051.1 lipid A biosynthesis acyltransferase [Flavobacterium sp. Fl-33]MDX6184652.1 lipid A biosynthesis acyltransferase [Flavobacterium sp. Fl-77]UFH39754.1 lipid A biosynthesis acyltransferase [Flavobacterium sp. F-70]
MSKWDGKSKGTVLGYRIFVFLIQKVGVTSAYFLLYFVASYYFLFLKKSNRAIFYYFKERLGFSYLKSKKMVFRSYYTFGQTIIDKISISAGMRNKFTYEFDGIEILKKLLAEKKGGVLISAHMGNFEIAEHFLGEIDLDFQINLVTTDLEHSAIKNYLESIAKKPTVKFIIIREDLSHIFEINAALSNNELICFTGDRYFEGTKSLTDSILGEEAHFPAGPFLIASRLKVPVVFVYVMKELKLHYHLYAREATVKHRDEKALLKEYIKSVENIVQKYPLQWFNYFDFWNKL